MTEKIACPKCSHPIQIKYYYCGHCHQYVNLSGDELPQVLTLCECGKGKYCNTPKNCYFPFW